MDEGEIETLDEEYLEETSDDKVNIKIFKLNNNLIKKTIYSVSDYQSIMESYQHTLYVKHLHPTYSKE